MIPPRQFLFYYRLLSHHRWLAERRSPLFASNRAAKWTMAVSGLLLAAYLVFIAVLMALSIRDERGHICVDRRFSWPFLLAEHPFSFSKTLRVVAHPHTRSHRQLCPPVPVLTLQCHLAFSFLALLSDGCCLSLWPCASLVFSLVMVDSHHGRQPVVCNCQDIGHRKYAMVAPACCGWVVAFPSLAAKW